MVVCRFFLQGNCKFGDKCWNEHPGGSTSSAGRFGTEHYKKYHYDNRVNNLEQKYASLFSPVGFSFNEALKNEIPNRTSFPEPEQTNKKAGQDELASIREDVISWVRGHIWPFTCYAPKHKGCLPGFVDLSPEELRWKYYEAQQTGTLHLFVQNVNESLREVDLKREKLHNPSPELIAALKSINSIDDDHSHSDFTNYQSVLSRTSFKLPETVSGFGSTQSSGFGNTQPSGFGNTQPSGFGNTQSSGFGNTQLSSFGNPKSSFTFKLPEEQSTSAFQLNQFRDNVHQNNVFGNSSQFRTPFSVTPETQSFPLFAGNSMPLSIQNNSFGASLSNSQNEMISSAGREAEQNRMQTCYTELNMLSKEEKDQFMSPTFVLGKIPAKPPPLQLCF